MPIKHNMLTKLLFKSTNKIRYKLDQAALKLLLWTSDICDIDTRKMIERVVSYQCYLSAIIELLLISASRISVQYPIVVFVMY